MKWTQYGTGLLHTEACILHFNMKNYTTFFHLPHTTVIMRWLSPRPLPPQGETRAASRHPHPRFLTATGSVYLTTSLAAAELFGHNRADKTGETLAATVRLSYREKLRGSLVFEHRAGRRRGGEAASGPGCSVTSPESLSDLPPHEY